MAKERIGWIDVAKGICIVAVVSMYASERVDKMHGAEGNWLAHWVSFARPFRMPDFFLISGLFLGRVIGRPWRGYLDKKVVHYLYFFTLWTLIYFPFLVAWGKAEPTPAALGELMYDPYAMLWFIQMLAVYFVATRLLKRAPVWAVFGGALLLQVSKYETGLHQLDRFGERYVYFFAGYAFAPKFFALADAVRAHPRLALAGLAVWAAADLALVKARWSGLPGVSAALGFAGACAVIAASSLLAGRTGAGWLAYAGQRSIAIYLSFLIPQLGFLTAVERAGWPADLGSLAAVATVLGVGSALLLDRLVAGTRLRWLFERPAWAKLEPAREPLVLGQGEVEGGAAAGG